MLKDKKKKTNPVWGQEALESHSDMARVLTLSDKEFKTIFNMLKTLMDKAHSMQKQIGGKADR